MKLQRQLIRRSRYAYGTTPYDDNSQFVETSSKYEKYQANNDAVDQGVAMGGKALGAINPALGALFQLGSGIGDAIAGYDKYGVAKSDGSAVVSSIFHPSSMLKHGINSFKEGKIGEGLLSFVPGLNGILGRKSARKRRSQIQEAEAAEIERQKKQLEFQADRAYLNTFDSQGIDGNINYFAFGGNPSGINIGGGNKVIMGAKHENGGVPVGGNELEGGEVLTSDGKVISNRITNNGELSLAEQATIISNTPAYKKLRSKLDDLIIPLEKDIEKENKKKLKNRFGVNTKRRNIDKLESKIEKINSADPVIQLFHEQEALKESGEVASDNATINEPNQSINTENMGYGGRMKRFGFGATAKAKAGEFAPYLSYFADNIANAQLIKRTPQVPEPLMDINIPLKTNYDITAPLNEIKRALPIARRNYMSNSSNSASARGAMAVALGDFMDKSNQLYTTKENQETALINADRQNAQNVTNTNVGKRNEYNLLKMRRSADILTKQSENWANLAGDFQDIISQTNQYNLDKDRISVLGKAYDNSGAMGKLKDIKWIQDAAKRDPKFLTALLESVKNNPTYLAELKKIFNIN